MVNCAATTHSLSSFLLPPLRSHLHLGVGLTPAPGSRTQIKEDRAVAAGKMFFTATGCPCRVASGTFYYMDGANGSQNFRQAVPQALINVNGNAVRLHSCHECPSTC